MLDKFIMRVATIVVTVNGGYHKLPKEIIKKSNIIDSKTLKNY